MGLAVSFLAVFITPQVRGSYYGQPSAALLGDQLFVTINWRRFSSAGGMWRGNFTPAKKAIRDPINYYIHTGREPHSTQAKLDIRDYRLLVFHAGLGHTIIPLADLQLLERSDLGRQLCRLRGYKQSDQFVNEFSGGAGNLLFPPFRDREPDVRMPFVGFGGGGNPERDYTQTARYDVQIAYDKTVRLFHAHKDKLFISLEDDYLSYWFRSEVRPAGKGPTTAADRKLRLGKLPADFTERFAAYTDTVDARDYLVTDNGKVYLSVAKGKTEVEVTPLWTDPKQRIMGVVKDMTDSAVYGWGFAGESGSTDRFYVKFDPKPVAKRYTLTVPLLHDRSDAYLESYECARAFRSAMVKK